MSCIFCFLKDSYQRELRIISQMQDERFEKILNKYKRLFINGFIHSLGGNLCEEHKGVIAEEIIEALKKINLEELEEFFTQIIENVYIKWIDGNVAISVENLKKLILEKKLDSDMFLFNVANHLFYRGRKISEGDILNTYDMFHIPFDKRYLIENQRFSLNGQPLLYLGGSPATVFEELDLSENELGKVAISSFYIKDKFFKVIDLRNPFYLYYKYLGKENNEEIEDNEKIEDNLPKIDEDSIKLRLFFLILSSVCCFEKRVHHKIKSKNMNVFFEEYIIPQTVTQVYKSLNKQGITFSSTRIKENIDNVFENDLHRTNLVIFTNYNAERHYDRKLYEKLVISNPITKKNIENFKLKNSHCLMIENEILHLLIDSIRGKKFADNNSQKTIVALIKYKEMLLIDEETETDNKNLSKKIQNFLIYNFLIKETIELREENNKNGNN